MEFDTIGYVSGIPYGVLRYERSGNMDAVHEAYRKCTRAIQGLPEAEQKRVVQALAILLGIIGYGGEPK